MKKNLITRFKTLIAPALILAVSTSATVLPSPQAHAALGLVGFGVTIPVLVILGGAGLGSGMLIGLPLSIALGEHSDDSASIPVGIATLATIIGGAILLDGEQQPTLHYASLSERDGKSLDLNEREIDSFNDNLDEINAVAETIQSDLRGANRPSTQLAQAAWKKYGSSLDAETLSVVQKVSARMAKSLQKTAQ